MRGSSLNSVPDEDPHKPFVLGEMYSFVFVAYLLVLGRSILITNALNQELLNIKLMEYFDFFLGYLNTSKYPINYNLIILLLLVVQYSLLLAYITMTSLCVSSTNRRLVCSRYWPVVPAPDR
jgi:hypothetical protein